MLVWTEENCRNLFLAAKIESFLTSIYLMLNDKDFKKVFHIPNYSLFEKDI